MKRIRFKKGRHVVGHGSYNPNDEMMFPDKLAEQLVVQDTAEYIEVSKPRKMVEKKAEVKVVETKLAFDGSNLEIDKATD